MKKFIAVILVLTQFSLLSMHRSFIALCGAWKKNPEFYFRWEKFVRNDILCFSDTKNFDLLIQKKSLFGSVDIYACSRLGYQIHFTPKEIAAQKISLSKAAQTDLDKIEQLKNECDNILGENDRLSKAVGHLENRFFSIVIDLKEYEREAELEEKEKELEKIREAKIQELLKK